MTRAKEILDIVHTDVLGKFPPDDVNGHCHTIGFVESFSGFSKVYFMKTRDEILDKLNSFVLMWESRELQFVIEVENTFQMSLSAFVGTKEFVLKTQLHILHKKMEKLKEFVELLLLWLADSWTTLVWTKSIGRML